MTSTISLPNQKITISPIGIQVSGHLSPDEWKSLAGSIGQAARSVGFIVGDWLVYGQSLFGIEGQPDKQVTHATYQRAIEATGLDLSTLQNYAYVSRHIPYSLRTERLSWEHHRLLAKLPEDEQAEWIDRCLIEEKAGRRISTRRLRKSINLGRIAHDADMEPEAADKGTENHIPFVNRLVGWWRRMQKESFLQHATSEQREALKRDLEPVIAIYDQL